MNIVLGDRDLLGLAEVVHVLELDAEVLGDDPATRVSVFGGTGQV